MRGDINILILYIYTVSLRQYRKYSICERTLRQKHALGKKVKKFQDMQIDRVITELKFYHRNNKTIKILTKLEELMGMK